MRRGRRGSSCSSQHSTSMEASSCIPISTPSSRHSTSRSTLWSAISDSARVRADHPNLPIPSWCASLLPNGGLANADGAGHQEHALDQPATLLWKWKESNLNALRAGVAVTDGWPDMC